MSKYATVGGILTIISGLFFIFPFIAGVFYALMPQLMSGLAEIPPPVTGEPNLPPDFFQIFTVFGVVICLFSVVLGALAITGGVFALKKKYWAIAIAGAVAGTLLFFPCGIAGTILISLGKLEFATDQRALSTG